MDDERIERALRQGPLDEPAYRPGLGDRVNDFAEAGDIAHVTGVGLATDAAPPLEAPRRIDVHARSQRSSSPLSLIASIAAAIAILVGGAILLRATYAGPAATPPGSSDALARLIAAGSVRIAVPDGPPQTVTAGGVHIGFDVDVANELAARLGLGAQVAALPAAGISAAGGAWDIALPGHIGEADPAGPVSVPYAWWPAWLAVAADASIGGSDALASQRICVVAGSAGADWVAGRTSDGDSLAPPGAVAVPGESDDACVTAIADGHSDALVTSTLLDNELAGRGLRVVGPAPVLFDPWTIVVTGDPTTTATLVSAIDRAIADLRASGRLGELSRASFGGRDVTTGGR